MTRDLRWSVIVAVSMLAGAACGDPSAEPNTTSPSPESVTLPPVLSVDDSVQDPQLRTPTEMIATPATVTAGTTVALTYADPVDGLRGAYFVVKDATGADLAGLWSDRYTETGAGWTPDIEHMEILDFAVIDEGPDTVIIPDILEPGEYTLCTLNARYELCTTLTVTAP